jgi:hypothetical protein
MSLESSSFTNPGSHHLTGPASDVIPLSYSQMQLWLSSQASGTSLNLPSVIVLSGPLRIKALEQSIRHVISRHSILRTAFKTVSGQLTQQVVPVSLFF